MPGGKSTDKKVKLPYQAKISSAYQKYDFKTSLGEAFKKKVAYEHENKAHLHNAPYQCCHLPDFIKDTQFLDGLKEELVEQIFYEKNNDLYKFQQTDDLKKISTPHVKCVRKLFYEDVLDWMKEVTGLPLNSRVDLTCSRYDYTDVLLCHDDELDTRRIAFILYLVPAWTKQDGGTLDLYDRDDLGQPRDIVQSLVPAWNSFVWFEVTEASFHQVSEVLNADKSRLSINGWFHSPPVARPERYQPPAITLQPYGDIEEDVMYGWINPIYLDPEVQGQIQEKFENDSEIELQGFIRDEKYQAVLEALHSEQTKWELQGPPNKRHYHSCPPTALPTILQDCLAFLQSEEMFLTLSNLTGLTLHPLAADNQSETKSEAGDDQSETRSEGGDDQSETGSKENEKIENDKMEESVIVNDATELVGNCDSTQEGSTQRSRSHKRQKLDSGGETNDIDSETKDEDVEMEAASGSNDTEETDKPADTDKLADTDKPDDPEKPAPRSHSEVRRWDHGSYSMLLDTDTEHTEYSLDARLFCGCKGWQQEFGGFTSYITKGEDEELLSVIPAENSLALVYRDSQTLRFVKHLNHRCLSNQSNPSFYDLSVVYYE